MLRSQADRITILRDGQTIETLENEMISEERIIRGMVGRDLVDRYPERKQMHEILFECVQSRLQISRCRLCIGHCSCVPLKHLMQECKAFVFLLFKF